MLVPVEATKRGGGVFSLAFSYPCLSLLSLAPASVEQDSVSSRAWAGAARPDKTSRTSIYRCWPISLARVRKTAVPRRWNRDDFTRVPSF